MIEHNKCYCFYIKYFIGQNWRLLPLSSIYELFCVYQKFDGSTNLRHLIDIVNLTIRGFF